jgi:hypothetical protein
MIFEKLDIQFWMKKIRRGPRVIMLNLSASIGAVRVEGMHWYGVVDGHVGIFQARLVRCMVEEE